MKKYNEDLCKKFNLPKYIKGKSFADASKAISAKFEGLNDKAAKDTEQALMQRLANMQEYIKEQEAPAEQYQNPMQQNQAFLGGMFGGEEGASMSEASGQANSKAGPGAYLAGAETIFESADGMFGNTDVDTSGAVGNMQKKDATMPAIAATAKGVSAGAQIAGPWGAAIGGVVGGTGSLIGTSRKNKDISKANQNFDIASVNKDLNSFKKGGYVNQNKYAKGSLLDINPKKPGYTNSEGKFFEYIDPDNPNENNGANGFGSMTKVMGIPGEVPAYKSLAEPNQIALNSSVKKLTTQEAADQSKQSKVGIIGNNNANKTDLSTDKNNNDKKNSNYLENAMRLAPVAMNAFQLATMEDPEVEVRQKNNRKFDPALIDENRAQRDILANQSNTNRALQNAANGSKGFVAANMLGSDLNTSKAIGQASVNAQAQNNSQTQFGQQFDNANENFNIQQNNLEQELTDRNKGTYDTNRAALLTQMGNDLGNLGKEQLFKKYPEMMGMTYDANGNYNIEMKDGTTFKLGKDGKPLKEDGKSEETNDSSMGGYQSSYSSHMNSLMPKKK